MRFLTRAGCHICTEAWPVAEQAARRSRVRLVQVDIETDDVLTREFALRIPVILGPDGSVLVEGPMEDWRELRKVMRRARRQLG